MIEIKLRSLSFCLSFVYKYYGHCYSDNYIYNPVFLLSFSRRLSYNTLPLSKCFLATCLDLNVAANIMKHALHRVRFQNAEQNTSLLSLQKCINLLRIWRRKNKKSIRKLQGIIQDN